jgi:squalene cyclase
MFLSSGFLCALCVSVVHDSATPESRAIAYLSREVPRWSADNKCYSCHNNGDAARALYTAHRLKHSLPAKTLDDTSAWLTKPENWHKNGGDVEFKDDGLARIQFAAALVEALEAGLVKERKPLLAAAELVAKDQRTDGSWQAQFGIAIGSPVTYGTPLATVQARRVLQKADADKYRVTIGKANDWLLKAPVARVLDAAAVLWGLDGKDSKEAADKRRQCLEALRKGQSKDGGWGPYVNAPPEVFDTALVVLALASLPSDKETREMLKRGRAYLIANQKQDGSWPETTRPTGAESYAQRLSTAGWATLALLATK